LAVILCAMAFGCAKTAPVDTTQVEELKKRQAELEASHARVLRELDQIRSELLVLEEALKSPQAQGQAPTVETKKEPATAIGSAETQPAGKGPKAGLSAKEVVGIEREGLAEAEKLIDSGQAAEAVFVLLDVEPDVSTDEERCQLDFLMARAYAALTEWQQSLNWAEGVDNNKCGDLIPKARLIRIECLLNLGRVSDAKWLLNSLVTEYPDSPATKEAQSLF